MDTLEAKHMAKALAGRQLHTGRAAMGAAAFSTLSADINAIAGTPDEKYTNAVLTDYLTLAAYLVTDTTKEDSHVAAKLDALVRMAGDIVERAQNGR